MNRRGVRRSRIRHAPIYSVKRFMGRRHPEVATEEKMVPYRVVGSPGEYVKIQVGENQYTPQEVSAKTLRKLKEAAESYLGHKVNKAVITVPAYFNDAQRQATKDAGQIAGLEVARIINEPTAAALAYGLDRKKDEKIVVFDLGGGTFDVSVLEVADASDDQSSSKVFQVISTSGDTHLGGDDFDEELINYVASEFKREHGIDLRKDTMALQRLQEACEKAKKELSSVPQTDINLPFITADSTGPKHLQMNITRSKFEELIDGLVERCRKPLMQAMQDANLKPSEIDEIVLVGGSTRVPKVRQMVKEIFRKDPHQGVNPDEVVAVGAAIQGSVLAGDRKDVLLLDVTPLTLGIETEGGIMTPLVERNTTIPVEKKNVFSTASDMQTGGDDQGVPGRAQDGGCTTACWANSIWRGFRRHPAACRRSRSSSTSIRTASSMSAHATWGPARRPRSASSSRPVCRTTKSTACGRMPSRTRRRIAGSTNWSKPATGPIRCAISWKN